MTPNELPEPTHVVRPKPSAEWFIPAGHDTTHWTNDFYVRRYSDSRYGHTVSITSDGDVLRATPTVATKLAAAILAAAGWTDTQDEPVMAPEPEACSGDESEWEQLLYDVVLSVCRPRMSIPAARELAYRIITDMTRRLRDTGKPT